MKLLFRNRTVSNFCNAGINCRSNGGYASWKERGADAIEVVRIEHPEVYLKVVASLLPKELNGNNDVLGDMTTEELERYAAILKSIIDRDADSSPLDVDHRNTETQH